MENNPNDNQSSTDPVQQPLSGSDITSVSYAAQSDNGVEISTQSQQNIDPSSIAEKESVPGNGGPTIQPLQSGEITQSVSVSRVGKPFNKLAKSVIGVLIIVLMIGLGGFLTLNMIAANSASDYNRSVSQYTDDLFEAMSTNLSSPNDMKEAVNRLSKPELPYVWLGDLVNSGYKSSQGMASALNIKLETVNKDISNMLIVAEYEKNADLFAAAESGFDNVMTYDDILQQYSELVSDLRSAAIIAKDSISDEDIKKTLGSIVNDLDILLAQIQIYHDASEKNDLEAVSSALSKFSGAYIDYKDYEDVITEYSRSFPGRLLGIANEIKSLKNDLNQKETQASSNDKWKKIANDYFHTCAISLDDRAYCWGQNENGELGNSSIEDSNVPVAVITDGVFNQVKDIAVGSGTSCAINMSDKLYCWGSNLNGLIGVSPSESDYDIVTPVAVDGGGLKDKTIKNIAISGSQVCALASDSQVYCWNDYYNHSGSYSPKLASNIGDLAGKTIESVSVGIGSVCVVASDEQAYCWNSTYGVSIGATTSKSTVPAKITGSGILSGKTIKSVVTGQSHACVLASDDNVYCWGDKGALGTDQFTGSRTWEPVAVSTRGVLSGKVVTSIKANYFHTCVTTSDNEAYCWGRKGGSIIGESAPIDSLLPVQVKFDGDIKSVYPASNYFCIVAADDYAYCFGDNYKGKLGNGTNESTSIMSQIKPSIY